MDTSLMKCLKALEDETAGLMKICAEEKLNLEIAREAISLIIEWRGKPSALRSDNGPEFIYIIQTLGDWTVKQQVTLL